MTPAALASAQHRWDYMEPPEHDDSFDEGIDTAEGFLAKARAARARREFAAADLFKDRAISALQDIPCQETP